MIYNYQKNKPGSINNNFIKSIFEDKDGNLWVGTNGGGLNKINKETGFFDHYQSYPEKSDSLSNNMVYSFLEDKVGDFWVGTRGGGLNKFDRQSGVFKHYKNIKNDPLSLSNNFVRPICEDSYGNLWIGTYGSGMDKFDKKSETFINYQNHVDDITSISNNYIEVIFQDSRQKLWIGTRGGGLNLYNYETKTFTHFKNENNNTESLSHNFVKTIIEDSKGNLWIGTAGGFNKYDHKTNSFQNYKNQLNDPESLSNDSVYFLFEDSKNDIWIGTAGGGLNRFNKNKNTFTSFMKEDGLSNNVIYGILEDEKGLLWISTNNGLSKFNPETIEFTNYNKKDGLQDNEFNRGACYKDRNGVMYFGGINGFNTFDPKTDSSKKKILQVIITDFLLFNRPVGIKKNNKESDEFQLKQHINYTEEIVLNYTDYIFTFEFAALNYSKTRKYNFKYKLEGLDDKWIITDHKNRRATYTALPAGDYIFKVKASDGFGNWSDKVASVKITVLPPFWKTIWFKFLVIFVIIYLLFYWHKTKLLRLSKKLKTEAAMEKYFIKHNITETEKEIILLIIDGKNNKDIEKKLFISLGTVRNNVSRIYKKLNIKSRFELIKIFKNID